MFEALFVREKTIHSVRQTELEQTLVLKGNAPKKVLNLLVEGSFDTDQNLAAK